VNLLSGITREAPAERVRVGDQTAMSSQGNAPQVRTGRVTWPLLSGLIPPLADSYVPRQETGLGLATSMAPGETGVLVPGEDAAGRSLGVMGGTGKTQLAAAVAHVLWDQRALDLLVWVTPSSRDAVLTTYAQTLQDVGEPVPGDDPGAAATQFLAWLAETGRPWLVVFDDLSDPAVLDGLWPQGTGGRVLVTTRRADAAVRAIHPRMLGVGAFSPREALAYLSTKLQADPDQWIGALDLAGDLGCLPIALAQAGAQMADTGLDCRGYRAMIADRMLLLAGGQPDAYPSIVAATWSLGVEWAEQIPPAGLARPALALAAVLDPNGIPGAVLTSEAARAYLARHGGAPAVTELQARTALYNLARAGLVSIDATSAARTVRVHALVQATVRQNLTAAECDEAVGAAAEALLQTWPRPCTSASFEQAMRDSTARLHEVAGKLLWMPECHPLLLRAGRSLETGHLAGPATSYWQQLLGISRQWLGPGHPQTLEFRGRLADALEAAGHPDDAVAAYEQALTEQERVLGPGHPDTLTTRTNLARAYRSAGRNHDAIRLAERGLAEAEHVMGPRHPDTLAARSEVAEAYLAAGMADQAIAAFQHTLAGREQVLGLGHPDTLAARANLAHAYRVAGRPRDAIPLYERTLADREHTQGPDHLDTLTARGNLAFAYRAAGRLKEALPLYKRTLADRTRVQGPDHPDSLTACGNLADASFLANRLKDAIPLFERTLAGRERVQGPDHPDTITARGNLASAYHSARKLAQAIPLYEQTLADFERVLGPAHPDTLASRGNLAHAYHTVGRQTEALTMFERTLADAERALGPDHPLTQTARENLQAVSRA
jgi:tetratricopeptide (TPR) repeat protein